MRHGPAGAPGGTPTAVAGDCGVPRPQPRAAQVERQAQPWERIADVLLAREAALCRIVAGVPPRDFAGLFIGQADVDALLRTLPGLDGPEPDAVADVRAAFAPSLARAREEFGGWLATAPDPLPRWVRSVGLACDDAEVLAVLCAVEQHPQRQRLVAYVQDNVQLPRPTLATLDRLFGPDHVAHRALAPSGRLRRAELATVETTGTWGVRMAAVPGRVMWALQGDDSADPDLPPDARRLPAPHPPGGWASLPPADRPTLPLADRSGAGRPRLLLVHGADVRTRLGVVADHHPGRGLLVTGPPASAEAWAAVVREATVADLCVVLQLEHAPDPQAVRRIEQADHLSWALSSAAELPLHTLPQVPWHEVDVPDGTAGPAEWAAAFGTVPADVPALHREQLRLVAAAAGGDPARLDDARRRLASGHLEHLAVRVRPRRGWPDLVLPADQLRQLHELSARHRRRGTVHGEWGFPSLPSRGVIALFAGPSGTGKTLAAEVVAGDLGLDLYKVDLSLVVSKWVGETEKNLGRIFDAAAAGDLVLFFDEADALFGKRSEVSDARDRYANIEVAYLLQRLESYDGLVILATNLQRNLDQAFLRRISVGVDFALPEQDQRLAIWTAAFPPAAPTRGLDLDFLARQFKVSGGVISNAARTAAFLAADGSGAGATGGPITRQITMEHVVLALKREFQKLGRMCTEAEFGDYHPLVAAPPAPPPQSAP